MDTIVQHHEIAAALFARLFLGMLFFFQGYDAIFKVKIKNVVMAYKQAFSTKGIPAWVTVSGSYFNSYTAFIGGILLIIGLFEYLALYILGLNLLFACIAFGVTTPMWDMKHVFPRLVLLLFLLSIPKSWKLCSLDACFFNDTTSYFEFIYFK